MGNRKDGRRKLSEYRKDNFDKSQTAALEAAEKRSLARKYEDRYYQINENIDLQMTKNRQEFDERWHALVNEKQEALQRLMTDALESGLVDDNGRYPWQDGYGEAVACKPLQLKEWVYGEELEDE